MIDGAGRLVALKGPCPLLNGAEVLVVYPPCKPFITPLWLSFGTRFECASRSHRVIVVMCCASYSHVYDLLGEGGGDLSYALFA